MPKYSCEGCAKTFPLKSGLTLHQSHCNVFGGSTSSLNRLITANAAKKKEELKIQAARRQAPPEDQDFVMDQDDYIPPALFDTPLELPSGTQRRRRLPKRFVDHLPSSSSTAVLPTTSLPHLLDLVPAVAPVISVAVPPIVPETPPDDPRVPHTTTVNNHGMFRVYANIPTDDPDDCLDLEDLCDSTNHSIPLKKAAKPLLPSIITDLYAPFKSAATFLLTNWANREVKEKSNEEMDELVHGVIRHPEFKINDLLDYSSKRENDRVDKSEDEPDESSPLRIDGWRKGSVKLRMPPEDQHKHPKGEDDTPVVEIGGIYYRPFLETILHALDDADSPPFHYTPYKEYWTRPDGTSERIYGEAYASDAWHEAHEEVQSIPSENGIENVVLPIILYSDSTHLANFGNAALWPLYMYFAAQSKYMRCKITEATCHHLAYIPTLPATIQEAYKKVYGRTASGKLLTFLKRELVQEILRLVLFHPDFLEAYTAGIEFLCTDRLLRRLFPRFMMYSADYPERMLIATLRNNGLFSSAKDLILKKFIHLLGTLTDRKNRARTARVDDLDRQNKITKARKFIFNQGLAVESAKVENILYEGSLIPIHNVFSVLSQHGYNYFDMFVPDLLHEFELGVWRSIFIHLIRILVAEGQDSVSILNKRFRKTPTFGSNTIRRFTDNTAAMRKLAARDFEDILQCSMPAFELLLPEKHNTIVLDLLFVLATWHAYAKLRMHTDTTVRLLDQTTTSLGVQLRHFKKVTCAAYETRELGKEVIARGRREAAMVKKSKKPEKQSKKDPKLGPKRKELNLSTPKLHALGGYAEAIYRFGTTDSYSTQIGETQHKRVKRLYGRTNKQNAAKDISKLEARVRRLREIHDRIARAKASGDIKNRSLASGLQESLPKTSPDAHYQMAASKSSWINPYSWILENEGDPALTDFMRKLRSHILSRILSRPEDGIFMPAEIDGMSIKKSRLYRHKVLRINYTSYDLRRLQDSLNPRTHADIMVLSSGPAEEGPYVYGRIVGLFHADVAYVGPGSNSQAYKRLDVAWVRWFQLSSSYSSGFEEKRLPQVRFVDHTDPSAFGFLDPDFIIRAAHLIPDFSQDRTKNLLPPSIARHPSQKDEDYEFYYVNIFADRDIFMRYRGGGIGHKPTWHLNDFLMKDIISTETTPEDEMEEDVEPPAELEADEAEDESSEEEDGDNHIEELDPDLDAEDYEEEKGEESEGFADL